MPRCAACRHEAPEGGRFCPSCGACLADPSVSSTATSFPLGSSSDGARARAGARGISDSGTGRFIPGTLLAGRYRILGQLGSGGMGEVYRADDLKLGQAVALKFLPAGFEKEPERLSRLLGEVKVARQISHPSVCRVYDVVETDGHHFISMEYVDGEDLASLLRRVGRLPEDRAIQIARQLCAGIAAAHEQGILHRDLKPANVMIDGRGKAKITDFGLARAASELGRADARAGTPLYMAPEQLAGEAASVKSDLYALGLVLYELFTGRRSFESPSSFLEGLDPAVERVILRCLEKEPRDRPSSALSVAAALPGGDPLAAALAAGETPSPELVAEAGETGTLGPALGATLLGGIVSGLVAIALLSPEVSIIPRLHLDKPPEALAVEAREMIRRFGYERPAIDHAQGFDWEDEYLDHVEKTGRSADRWKNLATIRPAPISFWYRESPRYLVTFGATSEVSVDDPPQTISGMTSLRLDARGRLIEFSAVPPERDDAGASPVQPDWSVLLGAAGLDGASLEAVPPAWNPLVTSDARAGWEGAYPGQPEVPVRVEAGAYRGKPVYFKLVFPWTKPSRMEPDAETTGRRVANVLILLLVLAIVLGGVLLARRNLRGGRGDRRGALRLAAYLCLLEAVRWLAWNHHVFSIQEEMGTVFQTISNALFFGGLFWVVYIALEPYARRLWPAALITWSRLLSGRLRDPRIGRDILIGALASVAASLFQILRVLVPGWLGLDPERPLGYSLAPLEGVRRTVFELLASFTGALGIPIVVLFLVLLLRILLRRQWAAVLAFLAFFTAVEYLGGTRSAHPGLDLVFVLASRAIPLFVLVRFGLLAMVFMQFFKFVPLYADLSTWYAGLALLPVLARIALLIYGFHISRAGRPLVRDSLLAE